MKIQKKDGILQAISQSEEAHWIQFELDEKTVKNLTKEEFPHLFFTKEAALSQYDQEFEEWKRNLFVLSKGEILKQLFQVWDHQESGIGDIRISEAMKEKIEQEFGVKV